MVSVPAALDAVRASEAAGALVPIENSVEGGVTATLDELAKGEPLMIYREVVLPIAFALLVRPGTALKDIKTVTGHPVAQPQVRNWLGAHLPNTVWESAASNADGARLVQEGRYDAAFAGEFAATTYGLEPLVTEIHDAANAETRFVLVGRPARPVAHRRRQDVRGHLARRRPPGCAARTAPGVRGARRQPDADRIMADRPGHRQLLLLDGRRGPHHGPPCGRGADGSQAHQPPGALPRAASRAGSLWRTRPPPRPGTSDSAFSAASDWLARCQDGRFLGRFQARTRSGVRTRARPAPGRIRPVRVPASGARRRGLFHCPSPDSISPTCRFSSTIHRRYPQVCFFDLGTSRQGSTTSSTNRPTGPKFVHSRARHPSSTLFP